MYPKISEYKKKSLILKSLFRIKVLQRVESKIDQSFNFITCKMQNKHNDSETQERKKLIEFTS